jgi:hypothetical protein
MAGMKGVSDDDIARWIFEDSEVEGEFSDESEHEETLPVCSDISTSESESSDGEESDDNKQNTLIMLCNLKYIIKSSGEFTFMFFSFETVG